MVNTSTTGARAMAANNKNGQKANSGSQRLKSRDSFLIFIVSTDGGHIMLKTSWRQSLNGLGGAYISTLQLGEDLRLARLGVAVDELELPGDPVQPVLDRGVADAKNPLHLFDGAVAAEEGDDKDLVVAGQPGQGRELETAFDGGFFVVQPDPFHQNRAVTGEPRKL
tara:strand:- start:796 stop:1296 length:501 start_codon:yes stop_codon:yes gene_type:complete